ncbi:MAG TPA: topoisomerase DNA-binding C4 zinc finger domain-containing protein [Chloroflexota bacterium]|nr:topoisomerase DNA-binding C4 zinc finger domain-containing protein [Chloroflexota bacterium]
MAGIGRPASTRRGRRPAALPPGESGEREEATKGRKGARGRPKTNARAAVSKTPARPPRRPEDRESAELDQQSGSTPANARIIQQPSNPGQRAAGVQCPTCGRTMVERSGPYGTFFGCSGFPGCRTTKPVPGGKGSRGRPTPRARGSQPPPD